MSLEKIGVEAVVEGFEKFKTSIDEMNRKTQEFSQKTAAGYKTLANNTSKYQTAIGKLQKQSVDYADTATLQFMLAHDQMEQFTKSLETTSTKLGITLTAAGAAILAAAGLSSKAAIEIESTQIAFDHMADSVGESSEAILQALKKASAGTISESDLMLSANRAMTLGVARNTREFTILMEIARDRARTMGLTTTQAFDNIVTGIGRGSPLILDNLGLLINQTEANEAYAKELGKTASELSETEKKQALLNEVLRQGQTALDDSTQSTMTSKEVMQALTATISNTVASLGKAFLPTIQTVGKTITTVVDAFNTWMDQNPLLARSLVFVTGGVGLLLTAMGGLILLLPRLASIQAGANAVMSGAALKTAAQTGALLAQASAHSLLAIATKGSQLALSGLGTAAGVSTGAVNSLTGGVTGLAGATNLATGSVLGLYSSLGLIVAAAAAASIAVSELTGNTALLNSQGEDLWYQKITKWVTNLLGMEGALEDVNKQMEKMELINQGVIATVNTGTSMAYARTEEQIKQYEALGYTINRLTGTVNTFNNSADNSTDEIDKIAQTIEGIAKAWHYSQTAAGRLGLTLEDMITFLVANGHSVEELKTKYQELGDNMSAWARTYRVTLEAVAFDATQFYAGLKSQAEKWVRDQQKALEAILEAEEADHKERLKYIDLEYRTMIESINKTSEARLKALDDELNAVDSQIEALNAEDKARADTLKKNELEARIATEYDLKRRLELNQELDDLIIQSNNEAWQKERSLQLQKMLAEEQNAEVRAVIEREISDYVLRLELENRKKSLESQKSDLADRRRLVEEEAEHKREQAQKTYEYQREMELDAMERFRANIKEQKSRLDEQLQNALDRFDAELLAFQGMNTKKLENIYYFVKEANKILEDLKTNQTITVTTVQKTVTESPSNPSAPLPDPSELQLHPYGWYFGLAEGGKVKSRPGGQAFILGEGGEDEYVIPESKLLTFAGSVLSKIFKTPLLTPTRTVKVMSPAGSNSVHNDRRITYDIKAHYSNPQTPQSLKYDLEAIAMMARS